MGIIERTYGQPSDVAIDEVLVSADSHVIEPEGLWRRELAGIWGDKAPDYGGRRRGDSPGAMDRNERVREMASDGVSGEVLYPTHGLRTLSLDDPKLEADCARVYNDWLADYCSAAPDRLIGLSMLSMYDVDGAVKEMQRGKLAGMRGTVIWQTPEPSLPFTSSHYDPFWAASQEADMPVNLHILSGHGYSSRRQFTDPENRATVQERQSVNEKLIQAMDSLYDLIFSGVLERYPRLKIVLVENELGWIPFLLEQWDYYFKRHGVDRPGVKLKRMPSEVFNDQIYVTFFNDAVGGHLLSWWGENNAMWSNDYPHGNSTWPNSRSIVARDMGDLPAERRAKLVRENVSKLYHIPVPTQATV